MHQLLSSDGAPYSAFCDDQWELVLSAAAYSLIFEFDSPLWESDTLYNDNFIINASANVDAKYQGFVSRPASTIRVCSGGSPACIVYSLPTSYANQPLRTIFSTAPKNCGTLFSSDSSSLSQWTEMLGFNLDYVWHSAGLCYNGAGINMVDGGGARARFGVLANNECNCDGSVNNAVGFGVRAYLGAGNGGVGITSWFGEGGPNGMSASSHATIWVH